MKFRFKRSISIILAVILTISAIPMMSLAASKVVQQGTLGYNGNVLWRLYDDGLLNVSGYDATIAIGQIAVPYRDQVKSIDLTESNVGTGADVLKDFDNLESIKLPQGQTVLEDNAFNGCVKLNSVTLSPVLAQIGNNAFAGCVALTSIELPKSLKTIGANAFDGCTVLAAINLPTAVDTIGDHAFANCSAITDLVLPESVVSIGTKIVENCTELKSFTYSSKITEIEAEMFATNPSLNTVIIPTTMTTIGQHAFYGAPITTLTIPYATVNVSNSSFNGIPNSAVINTAHNQKAVDALLTNGIISNDVHEHVCYKTAPANCISPRIDTYICVGVGCSDGYEEKVGEIDPNGHEDKNHNNTCDLCGNDDYKQENCSCACHATSPLIKFLYGFLLMIWKLFKTNQFCQCGAKHF